MSGVVELQWIGENAPADAEMVRYIDETLAAHEQWDSPVQFQLLAADRTGRIYSAMSADLRSGTPDTFPFVFGQLTGTYLGNVATATPRSEPAVACLVQFETNVIVGDPATDLTDEERAAVTNRTVRSLPQRVEFLYVCAADPSGRVWCTSKRRGTGGAPDEVVALAEIRGSTVDALRAAAEMIPPAYVAASRSGFWTHPQERG